MDAHTHHWQNSPHIYVLSQAELQGSQVRSTTFCAGIHPWHVKTGSTDDVRRWAQQPGCVAIGETGLDRLHPHWPEQMTLLNWHWDLAEELHKPLVIHVVRASSDVSQLLKRRRPRTPWLWHDFTGPIEAVPRLLKLHPDLYFSCGIRLIRRPDFRELWEKLPRERRLLESDDSGLPIEDIYARAGVISTDLTPNYRRLFDVHHL